MRIEELSPREFESATVGLAKVMVDCVDDGASVGFLAPLDMAEAAAWWSQAVQAPGARTWVARSDDDVIHGCVQLKPAHFPNGRHRGDVAKLLVHRRARGRALGQALMEVLEAGARDQGLTLLVLDTTTGSFAESLYPHWGWTRIGVIEDFAALPDGRLAPTTRFAKHLQP